MALVQLNEEIETVNGISLTPSEPTPTSGYVEHLGTKLHLTLGEKSPGADEIVRSMSSGNADYYKQILADQDAIQRQDTKNAILSQIMEEGPENITPEVVSLVQGLSQSEMARDDIGNLLEEKYAKLYTNMATGALENDVLEEAMVENPEASYSMIDRAERTAYKNNYALSSLDKIQKEYAEAGFLSKAVDFGERLIPFREWYLKTDTIGEDMSGILPGDNLISQFDYLQNTDPEDFKVKFDTAVKYLMDTNPQVAMAWVESFLSYGSSDALLDNVFGVLDVASVVPVTKVGKLAGALRGVVKGSIKNPNKLYEITAELGKNFDSATGKVIEDITNNNFFKTDVKNWKALEDSLPSIFKPDAVMSGGTKLPVAAYNRLKQQLMARTSRIQEVLLDVNQVDTLSPDEVLKLSEDALSSFKKDYPSIQLNVIDVKKSTKARAGNVYGVDIVIGQRDGTLFESEKQALNYVNRYIKPKFGDVRIEQVGDSFQGIITKDLDESKLLDDFKLELDQVTPTFTLNKWLRSVRSPDYLLPKQNVEARGVTVHSTEQMAHLMDELSKPLANLDKRAFKELDEILVQNRKDIKFYDNIAGFEEDFFSRFKKAPSEEQIDAYYSYVQINDLDLIVRDLQWYKQKAALGLEDISIKMKGGDPLDFEGKIVDSLPFRSDAHFYWSIIENGAQVGKAKYSKYINTKDIEEISKLKDKGYKIIQVANQNLDIDGRGVGFVITKDFQRSRIGVKNVDRKPGGHKVHRYDFYVKQGKIKTREDGSSYYAGDLTLFNARTEKEAKEFVSLFDQARIKVLNKDPDAMKFIRDNLPITPKEFMLAVKRKDIDLSVPISYTRSGMRTFDTGQYARTYPNLEDLSENPNNLLRQVSGKFGGERSQTDISIIKDEGNSIFSVDTAEYLSPVDTLRVATQNMIQTHVFNDYTSMTARNFAREFGDILDGSYDEIKANLQEYLVNPKFKPGVEKTEIARVEAAKAVSQHYRYLVGYGTALDNKITLMKDKLVQSVMPKLPDGAQRYVEERLLSRVKDPTIYMRSIAFHTKMGFFNPKQFFLQANSLVNIVAVGGRNGIRGGLSYPWIRAAMQTNDPNIIKSIAKKVQATGLMKADEFEEAFDLYKKSGFHAVGKDVAYLDDLKSPDVRTTKVGKATKTFLDWGTTPFKEGERIARISAWMTAYLDQKATLKGGQIGRRESARILQRAKDLTGNMTRDSNAAWQKGYGSVFTQFYSYQARIMEQLLGKKLTGIERARLFTGYSMFYGVPTAVGATIGIVPVREMIREEMISQGYDPDNSSLEPFIDGFASSMMEYITGTDTNVAASYGPGGLTTLYDLIRGDKEVGDIFLGASGSIISQIAMDSYPALKAMRSEFMDFEGGIYNLRKEDFIKPLRNISSVDNAVKLWDVYHFGIWASRNNTNIIEMELPDAVIAAITGLQPQEIEDTFARFRTTKEFQDYMNSTKKELISMYRTAIKMDPGEDREILIREIKALGHIKGLTPKEMNDVWRKAFDIESLQDKSIENYDEIMKRKLQ